MRMGDGTRQWYMVRDKDDRRYFDRRAGPMANRFGIDISLASHNRFYELLGEDWLLSYSLQCVAVRLLQQVEIHM